MTTLSSEDISHLGRLARLDLTTEEQERFATQLSSVVGYVEQLAQVNTDQITDLHGVTGLTNVLAADQERQATDLAAIPREQLLKGAPAQEDGYFVVRAVLGDEVAAA